MKTSLLFLSLYGLLSFSPVAKNLPVRSDTTRVAELDSVTLVRSDSTHAPEPFLNLTGNLELTKSYYAIRNAEAHQIQNTPWYLSGALILTTRSGWTIPLQGVWSYPAETIST